jgi:hypothetical protein
VHFAWNAFDLDLGGHPAGATEQGRSRVQTEQLAIHSLSTKHRSLEEALNAYTSAGFRCVEPYLPLGEASMEDGYTIEQTRGLLDSYGLEVVASSELAVECFHASDTLLSNVRANAENARLTAELGGMAMIAHTDGPERVTAGSARFGRGEADARCGDREGVRPRNEHRGGRGPRRLGLTGDTVKARRRASRKHRGLRERRLRLRGEPGGRRDADTIHTAPANAPVLRKQRYAGNPVEGNWLERFPAAYVLEMQRWVEDLRDGRLTGPDAWDGYISLLAVESRITSLRSGPNEPFKGPQTPELYRLSFRTAS